MSFSRLFLIASFSILQLKITYMRALMILKFDQLKSLVFMVKERAMKRKTVSSLFLGCFSSVPRHIAGNNDMRDRNLARSDHWS